MRIQTAAQPLMVDQIAALKRTTLFKELDDETLRLVAERVIERRVPERRGTVRWGETARGLYVIVEGVTITLTQTNQQIAARVLRWGK